MKFKDVLFVAIASAIILPVRTSSAQLTPSTAIGQMIRGINMGNTLEPPTEGAWNNGPAQEYYFDDYKTAGFSTVRIPVRWDQHTASSPPYAVTTSWMNRVEQIVDWALERDLFVVINGHHEDWLKNSYANAASRARYDSIWVQIAERFRDHSDKLFFEIMNEPFGMNASQVDDLNARVLGIIRETNPTRIVIYSGHEWSGADQMMGAAVPDDPYLMAYYHSYDPWSFGGLGEGTWGSAGDRQQLEARFQSVANWSSQQGMPVHLSEFGVVRIADYNSRMAYYAAAVEGAVRHGIAFQVWDDGGDFGIYNRGSRTWPEVKDILISTYPTGPTGLQLDSVVDSVVTLSWTNRGSYGALRVEEWTGSEFTTIAELPGTQTTFADSTVAPGVMYTYRVVAYGDFQNTMMSYPQRIRVLPTTRTLFNGTPFVIPGVIEAEDFDIGGEGLTYHDTDEANIPSVYRTTESVDIEARDGGGYQVAYIEAGEWIEYSINVEQAGKYTVTCHVASLDGGGTFRLEFATASTRTVTVPDTDSWQTLSSVSTSATLPAGEQIMRFRVFSVGPFNIDRFEFTLPGATAIESIPDEPDIRLYPNPASDAVHVALPAGTEASVELFNMIGQRVGQTAIHGAEATLALDGLPAGVYFVRVQTHRGAVTKSVVLRR